MEKEKTITVRLDWLKAVANLIESCVTLITEGANLGGQPPEEILSNTAKAVKETIRIHTQ